MHSYELLYAKRDPQFSVHISSYKEVITERWQIFVGSYDDAARAYAMLVVTSITITKVFEMVGAD